MTTDVFIQATGGPDGHIDGDTKLEYSRCSHDNQSDVSNQATVCGLSRWSRQYNV